MRDEGEGEGEREGGRRRGRRTHKTHKQVSDLRVHGWLQRRGDPMVRALRPSLYRTIKVVMSDGATFHVPSAVRTVGNTLQLERDTANHPAYLVRRLCTLRSARPRARATRSRARSRLYRRA